MSKLFRSWSAISTGVGIAVAVLGAAVTSPFTVLIGVVVSLIGELFEHPKEPLWYLFDQAELARPLRALARGLAIVVVFPGWPSWLFMLGIVLSNTAGALASNQLEKDYARPVYVQRIPGVEPPPSSWVGLVVIAELIAYLGLQSHASAIIGAAGFVAIMLCGIGLYPSVTFVLTARRAYTSGKRKPSLAAVQKFIDTEKPVWVLHASGTADTAYQIDVWLPTLERLNEKGLVLLRDNALFEAMPKTTLPVVNLPGSVDVMALDWSKVHVALFPAHVGNSVHLLRLPSMGTAFIGHGDSDKSGSSNPFARAYDQVWVAGKAGAQRYADAGLELAAHAFVEVGRPQTSAIETTLPSIPTVLYAPTWEGWNTNQEYSSLLSLGPHIVQTAIDAGLRIIYRPHPLTGLRNPRYRVAHEKIIALLMNANGETPTPAAVENSYQNEQSAAERERLLAESSAAYFQSLEPSTHVIADSQIVELDLSSCFNASSALITDVSSLITDYLASDKPYAVFDHAGDKETLQQQFPSTAAATIISSADDIAAFINIVNGHAPDVLKESRSQLRQHTLGNTSGIAAFEKALHDLAALAQVRASRF